MINIEAFKKLEIENTGKEKVVFSTAFSTEDSEAINNCAEKFGLSKSAMLRYFALLGMQAHRKRNKLRKRYESIIEEDMIREEIVEEFHRRIAAEEGL